jgi:protein dithiol oxidoreductase (disulfide-forming)
MTQRLACLALLALLGGCGSRTATAPATPAPAAPANSAPAPVAAAPTTPASTQPSAGESADVGGGETDRTVTGLERLSPLPAAGNLPAGRWVAGQHYRPLSPAQPTSVSPGKVEVVEVFWYGCSHCYAFEPYLDKWEKTKPAYVELVRVPVMWSATHRAHARLYYTLQALGKADQLHTKVFDEIHKKNNTLLGSSDDETKQLQLAFATANGISAQDFTGAYNSFTVQTKLQQAEELTERYKVDGVPVVVINGKYVSDVGMAGNQANLISLINDLVAAEKRR